MGNVPLVALLVSDGPGQVSPVDGGHERDVLPVLALQVFKVCEGWGPVPVAGGHRPVLLDGHAPLLHVDGLKDAAVPVDYLQFFRTRLLTLTLCRRGMLS